MFCYSSRFYIFGKRIIDVSSWSFHRWIFFSNRSIQLFSMQLNSIYHSMHLPHMYCTCNGMSTSSCTCLISPVQNPTNYRALISPSITTNCSTDLHKRRTTPIYHHGIIQFICIIPHLTFRSNLTRPPSCNIILFFPVEFLSLEDKKLSPETKSIAGRQWSGWNVRTRGRYGVRILSPMSRVKSANQRG